MGRALSPRSSAMTSTSRKTLLRSLWQRFPLPRKLLTRYGTQTSLLLVLLLLVVGGGWGFVALAGEVLEGDTRALDEWVLTSLRRPDNLHQPIGPHWLVEAGRDLTALGSISVLLLFILIVAGYLGLDRKYRAMLFLLAATSTGFALSFGLKSYFERPRPDLVPHLTVVQTASFPSGHAMLSAVVYLTLGALLMPLVARRLKFYVITVAILLTVLIGLSRIYMGVHYPTDVLAGWTAGLVWATLSWLVLRVLQRRGQAEEQTG